MSTPELNRSYTIEETWKNWSENFDRRFYFQFYIPTEDVVYEPRYVVPMVARAWATDWYFHEGKLAIYKELMALPVFKGTGYFPRIICMEMWSNYGDDGHTEFRHVGYAFFAESSDDAVKPSDLSPKGLLDRMKQIERMDYDRIPPFDPTNPPVGQ